MAAAEVVAAAAHEVVAGVAPDPVEAAHGVAELNRRRGLLLRRDPAAARGLPLAHVHQPEHVQVQVRDPQPEHGPVLAPGLLLQHDPPRNPVASAGRVGPRQAHDRAAAPAA